MPSKFRAALVSVVMLFCALLPATASAVTTAPREPNPRYTAQSVPSDELFEEQWSLADDSLLGVQSAWDVSHRRQHRGRGHRHRRGPHAPRPAPQPVAQPGRDPRQRHRRRRQRLRRRRPRRGLRQPRRRPVRRQRPRHARRRHPRGARRQRRRRDRRRPARAAHGRSRRSARDAVGSAETMAEAVRYAVANGAKIINMSACRARRRSQGFEEAVQAASDAGVIMTVAAGNSGHDLDEQPELPRRLPGEPRHRASPPPAAPAGSSASPTAASAPPTSRRRARASSRPPRAATTRSARARRWPPRTSPARSCCSPPPGPTSAPTRCRRRLLGSARRGVAVTTGTLDVAGAMRRVVSGRPLAQRGPRELRVRAAIEVRSAKGQVEARRPRTAPAEPRGGAPEPPGAIARGGVDLTDLHLHDAGSEDPARRSAVHRLVGDQAGAGGRGRATTGGGANAAARPAAAAAPHRRARGPHGEPRSAGPPRARPTVVRARAASTQRR